MKKSLMAALAAVFVSSAPIQAAPVQNEILFLMDSSGSMFDTNYLYWQSSIDWVQNFVDQTHRADGSNAYGIINFSGGTASQTVQNAADNNRLNLVYGLSDPSIDYHTGNSVPGAQDKASLDAFIGGMGSADFRGGHTWTDAALNLAHNTFLMSPNPNTNKFIFLLTDGHITPGQEPVIADPGTGQATFESDTYQDLQAAGVTFSAVTVQTPQFSQSLLDQYLLPFASAPENLFSVTGTDDFSNFLPSSSVAMPAPAAAVFIGFGAIFVGLRRRHKTFT